MMDELKPAQTQSLGERLLGLVYGGTDAESEYYKRQAREAELRRMEQKAFEDQGGGLEAQIPGGNPEAPTPLDALVGALMSMGGVPPSVARSGTAPTIPAPRPAQKNSLITSEPEWMSSAPGGRVPPKSREDYQHLSSSRWSDKHGQEERTSLAAKIAEAARRGESVPGVLTPEERAAQHDIRIANEREKRAAKKANTSPPLKIRR